MRIVSYNIRKALGLDGRRDPARVLSVVAALDADVVVLQEVDRRLGQRPTAVPAELIETETDLKVVPLARSPVSLGWHGNAILVRRSLRVRGPHRIDLPGLEPRGAVAATVQGAACGIVTVVGAHLGLLRPYRLQQLEAIKQALPVETQPTTVIAGDFNEWSQDRGMEPLAGAFVIDVPGYSFPAARPIAPLDRFAVGHGLRVRESGVATRAPAQRASDHLPIWAQIDTV